MCVFKWQHTWGSTSNEKVYKDTTLSRNISNNREKLLENAMPQKMLNLYLIKMKILPYQQQQILQNKTNDQYMIEQRCTDLCQSYIFKLRNYNHFAFSFTSFITSQLNWFNLSIYQYFLRLTSHCTKLISKLKIHTDKWKLPPPPLSQPCNL